MKKFWIIKQNTNCRRLLAHPSLKFDTEQEAKETAEDLARKTGESYTILSATDTVTVSQPVVWKKL